MIRLIVSLVKPPIPTTKYDYCCYIDGDEERHHVGYGSTPASAVQDFLDEFEEDIDEYF
jgi:hypothetical protein